ncbi:GHMP family kinase ATP-binding protein [Enteractinococcus coprophilus]|uniref:4-diphosphocytidyl-2-C-methyl-D-erythritol kinase n=1 Tax=Enteractinococcus coprophilus TaxID=1027633 RepID=A0A543AFC3_9MICC|nr:hypothetical protein [Enteractinococcus coprophilus]TQL71273.1 4-diphosphocytidyl-2-C-methyl-D-erythritol kinase [Enteractinococcus coprophilus]
MSSHRTFEARVVVSAQAPAMVPIATKVGDPNDFDEVTVSSLQLAISRYDVAVVEARQDKEVFVSFEDGFQNPIDYADIPQRDMAEIFRAVDELRAYLQRPRELSGLDITVQKNIPFETHLGGRPASTAAVLVALARLWHASIAREELTRLANRIGDGVAAALTGGALITTHNGQERLLTPLLVQRELAMVIVPAAVDIEPQEMFQKVRMLRQAQADTHERNTLEFESKLLHAVTHGDAEQVALMMHNDFQSALVNILPDHNDWLTAGMNEGALAAQTVGAGASLVFMVEDMSQALELAERFEDRMEISAVAEYGPVAGAHLL